MTLNRLQIVQQPSLHSDQLIEEPHVAFGIMTELGNEKWTKVCSGIVSESGVSF